MDNDDEAALLAELRAISSARSDSRFGAADNNDDNNDNKGEKGDDDGDDAAADGR